jgi:hypothetical protein
VTMLVPECHGRKDSRRTDGREATLTVDKIDKKSLDMGTIRILICHDHQVSVAQRLDIGLVINGSVFQTHDIDHILDLFVLHDCGVTSVTDIEWFTLQWEDTIEVTANDRETGHGKRLGGVSLGDNQGTVLRLGSSGMVGIIELGDSSQLDFLYATLSLHGLILLVASKGQDGVNDVALLDLLQELVGEFALCSEILGASRQKVFRLTVKGGIFDQAVDKDGEMVLDLIRLDLGTSLVLLLDDLDQMVRDLVGNVRDVATTFRRTDGVHE